MKSFSGTKVALINNGKVLTILRDDKPNIDFPGFWDLPGGARDQDESAIDVAMREINEELGIKLVPQELIWQRVYPAVSDPTKKAIFMVFEISDEQLSSIKFGDEGQEWRMVPFKDFVENPKAVPGMQIRLRDYLATRAHGQTEF